MEGLDLEVPGLGDVSKDDVVHGSSGRDAAGGCLLAVDLGTTSICWQAVGEDGEILASGGFLNPQAGAGADVMSRLALARRPEMRRRLSTLVRSGLTDVCERLPWKVRGMCLAGNTAMTAIFLDRDVEGLCVAPYRVEFPGDSIVDVPGFPPAYIPPLPAPFIGGDVSAGLAALLKAGARRPFVLADIGTNGEFACITESGEAYIASVPMGPALEGIGLACGHIAGPDVVTDFAITPAGLETRPDLPMPRGISATGYLALLSILLQWKALDRHGHFARDEKVDSRLLRGILDRVENAQNGLRLLLPHGLWLTAGDVEELLKVKAAFSLALEKLLAAAGVTQERIADLWIAGTLGEHANPEHLETLGFIPRALTRKVRVAGNTSLRGAALLVRDNEARRSIAALCAGARLVHLVEDADGRAFLDRMVFD
jgi:uncharacterized 2Fe-2S/4Fe-4S cluster protein (DUF4445 family)